MDLKRFQEVVARMGELLRLGGKSSWASALQRLKDEAPSDPVGVRSKTLSMFGGMGSLNDIVLYSSGTLLLAENNEFDQLRRELYSLCHPLFQDSCHVTRFVVTMQAASFNPAVSSTAPATRDIYMFALYAHIQCAGTARACVR
jgi:hypothetical protein